jgi:hypothetical protein
MNPGSKEFSLGYLQGLCSLQLCFLYVAFEEDADWAISLLALDSRSFKNSVLGYRTWYDEHFGK